MRETTNLKDCLQNELFVGDKIRVAHYWAHGFDAIGYIIKQNDEYIVQIDFVLLNNTLGSVERLIRIGWKVYREGGVES